MIGAFVYKNINGITHCALVRVYNSLDDIIKRKDDEIELIEASINNRLRFTIISMPFDHQTYKLDVNETMLSFEELPVDPRPFYYKHNVDYGLRQTIF